MTVHSIYREAIQPDDVYVGRAGHGYDGYFGNPIIMHNTCPVCSHTHTELDSLLNCYRVYVANRILRDPEFRERVRPLHDKRLFCFCAPKPCHATVLQNAALWLLNKTDEEIVAALSPKPQLETTAPTAEPEPTASLTTEVNNEILVLTESNEKGYARRTATNAHQADLTIRFAWDMSSPGERLTAKVARRFVDVNPCEQTPEEAAAHILSYIRETDTMLNIAGHSIARYLRAGFTQHKTNTYIYMVLKLVHEQFPIQGLRSGGQTGADHAGLVAGVALGIQSHGHYPLGYMTRNANNQDEYNRREELRESITEDAKRLLR